MNHQVLDHRSSRVIAATRIALALLFALWIWVDPEQPQRGAGFGAILLAAYLLFAIAQMVISQTNWWLDFRLSKLSFLIDVLVFLASMYFTESREADFASPYITFFAFLTIVAAVRRDLISTAWVAFSIAIAYLAMALILERSGLDLDIAVYVRRISFLAALSLILAWLALRRSATLAPRLYPHRETEGATPLINALAYAMDVTGAVGGALAWANQEEPRTRLQLAGSIGNTLTQLAPGTIDTKGEGGSANEPPSESLASESLASEILPRESKAMLFDRARRRMLASGPDDDRLVAYTSATPDGLAQYLGISEGLSLPLEGTSGWGQLILTGIPGLCRDDIELSKALSREITRGFDEAEVALLNRNAAVERLRNDLARDLHDSVAQTLAGVGFRLQGLHHQIESGRDPQPEIDAATRSIQTEQAHILAMIERLRSGKVLPGNRNLEPDLAELLSGLEQQWQITARLNYSGPVLRVPTAFVYEIQQLVRESVANAVRHGAARTITVNFERSGDQLLLDIGDDGTGLDQSVGANLPKSLAERVETLAGKIAVSSRHGETHVLITVPLLRVRK